MAEEWTYDLFVSYVEADKNWVEIYLLDALKNANIRYIHKSAFALGVPLILEFERAIQQSRKTLLVISQSYLENDLTRFTEILAQSYGQQEGFWQVIPLFLQEGLQLPPRLKMLGEGLKASSLLQGDVAINRLCDDLKLPPPPPPTKPACPYPGMSPFEEKDEHLFFGRNVLIEESLKKLRLNRLLTVIGSSGSGKSSLVFAGLIPKLKQSGLFGTGQWCVRSFRPGTSPLANLQAKLGGDVTALEVRIVQLLSTQPDTRRSLLVVDQFEELFTQGGTEVTAFQETLLRLMEIPNIYLILTVRADFYPDLMESVLWEKIHEDLFPVRPLNEKELKKAIISPAEGVRVYVEPVLVERLLVDGKEEPGVLPLLQETLVQLWDNLERRFLALSAYQLLVMSRSDSSTPPRTGLQVAIADRADTAYKQLGTEEKQAIARRIFLRLIQFGEGRADTRRQQSKSSLASGNQPLLFEETLDHLVNSRLLTLSGEEKSQDKQVDIAHEALISGWPKLGGSEGWIRRRREEELTRRRLESKVQEWVKQQRGLLDKDELANAQSWLSSPDAQELGYSDLLQELVNKSKKEIKKSEFLRWSGIAVIVASIMVAGGWTLYQNQKALLDSYARWSGFVSSSSDLKFLQDRFEDAEKLSEKGDWKRAIAYYRQINVDANRIEGKDQKEGEELVKKSEYSIAKIAYENKDFLPKLKSLLDQKNFGSSPKPIDTSRLDKDYKGAMQFTYQLLRLDNGIGADMNENGKIDSVPEANILPCDTLRRIDYLWRTATNQKCGWSSDCNIPVTGRNLINHIFGGNVSYIATRWDEECQNPTPMTSDDYAREPMPNN